mgnify:CR=1 FL=1
MIFGDSISVASNLLDSQHLKHDTISHIKYPPMRPRRGPGIPASGLLPLRRRRLRANTRGDGVRGRGRGGRSVTQPPRRDVARRPSSKQSKEYA